MTRKNSRALRRVAVIVAIPLMIAACGSTSDPDDTTPTPSDAAGVGDDLVLNIGTSWEPGAFQPSRVQQPLFPFTRQLYDSLVDYDDTMVAQPQLATSWTISDAQDSVDIVLRDDVTFHSGEPFTAQSVAQNLEYFADPETGQQMFGPMGVVKDWTVTDDTHLTVNFIQPLAEMQITDLLQAWTIGDPAEFGGGDDTPAGTGPYRFVTWEPGVRVVLERNEAYWGGAPAYATLNFLFFDDDSSMVAGFEAGQLDVVAKAPTLDAQRLASSYDVIEGFPGALIDQWRINPNSPPFDNANVRQAVSYATDRESILSTLYHGYSSPLTLPYGEGSAAYDQELADSLAFDLDKARELLETSGLSPDELTGEISVNSSTPAAAQAAQLLQASMNEIGFTMNIRLQDGVAYSDSLLEGDFQIVFGAIGNAQKFPTRITTNTIYRTEGNPVNAPDLFPEYAPAVAALNAAVTESEQAAAIDHLNQVLVDTMWVPTIGYLPYLWLVNPEVTGVARNVDNMMLLGGATPAS